MYVCYYRILYLYIYLYIEKYIKGKCFVFLKMGKRVLSLYVDDEYITIAKARNMNLSRFFVQILKNEIELKDAADALTKEELINKLKARIGLLSDELDTKIKQIEKLKKENEELKKKSKDNDDEEYISYEFPSKPR